MSKLPTETAVAHLAPDAGFTAPPDAAYHQRDWCDPSLLLQAFFRLWGFFRLAPKNLLAGLGRTFMVIKPRSTILARSLGKSSCACYAAAANFVACLHNWGCAALSHDFDILSEWSVHFLTFCSRASASFKWTAQQQNEALLIEHNI